MTRVDQNDFLTSKIELSRPKSLFVQISSPEALAASIRILLMFSIVLVHSRSRLPTFFKKAAKARGMGKVPFPKLNPKRSLGLESNRNKKHFGRSPEWVESTHTAQRKKQFRVSSSHIGEFRAGPKWSRAGPK